MPYKLTKMKGPHQVGQGYKVTSPNHPHGFSKQVQTKAKAEAQMRAIYANAPPEKESKPESK